MKSLINKEFINYIVEENSLNGGTQLVFKFENGFGASLVQSNHSYGNELAVISFVDEIEWHIDYSTSITDDVIGYLNEKQINEYLKLICELGENL